MALARLPAFRAVDGLVRLGGRSELPARAYMFRAPRSYTRQDVVELHLPGSAVAAGALLEGLIAGGAQLAEAGEFTARAFFSGRIDLSAAEAVADVIEADDDAQLRSALAALGGRTHRLCVAAAEVITEALATVEASIDLAEEDIQLDAPGRLADVLTGQAEQLRRTARQAADMPETAQHVTIALAGRPNVGKSSLVNALAGSDRAIVSAMAGTTRDVLSTPMTLGETAVVLQDAAGFARAEDELTVAADSAARAAVRRADVVCFVVDVSDGDFADDLDLLADVRAAGAGNIVLLANKVDRLTDAAEALTALAAATGLPPIATSAVTAEGLDAVRAELTERLHVSAGRGGSALGLHQRQKRCLLAAADAATAAAAQLADSDDIAASAELVAIDLREALADLDQISGDVVTDDVLGRIFARFCVGK